MPGLGRAAGRGGGDGVPRDGDDGDARLRLHRYIMRTRAGLLLGEAGNIFGSIFIDSCFITAVYCITGVGDVNYHNKYYGHDARDDRGDCDDEPIEARSNGKRRSVQEGPDVLIDLGRGVSFLELRGGGPRITSARGHRQARVLGGGIRAFLESDSEAEEWEQWELDRRRQEMLLRTDPMAANPPSR